MSHEGAWRADEPGNSPGIFMPADPQPGMIFVQEGAPGIAEDRAKVVAQNKARTPAGLFTDVIGLEEKNPLDGGTGFKVFARDVGLVIDGPVKLNSYTIVS